MGSAGVEGDDLQITEGAVLVSHGGEGHDPLVGRLIHSFDQAGAEAGLAHIDQDNGKAPLRQQGKSQDLIAFDDPVLDPTGCLPLRLGARERAAHVLAKQAGAIATLGNDPVRRCPMQPCLEDRCHPKDGQLAGIEPDQGRPVRQAAKIAERDLSVGRQHARHWTSSLPALAEDADRVRRRLGQWVGLHWI